LVNVGKVTIAYVRASDPDLTRLRTWLDHLKIDIFHRRPDETFDLVFRLMVVANSAALRRAVKRMDRQRELVSEFFCRGNWQWRAGGNTHAQLRERRNIFHFAKRLVEERHTRENRRVCFCDVGENSARRSVLTKNKRHTAGDQGREQIAESVGMRNRNDAEVKIGIGDTHRIANLVAISQELFAAKSNCARRGGGFRSELEKHGWIVSPMSCSCRCPHRQNLEVPAASDGGSYNATRITNF